jgi:hypothetical protein
MERMGTKTRFAFVRLLWTDNSFSIDFYIYLDTVVKPLQSTLKAPSRFCTHAYPLNGFYDDEHKNLGSKMDDGKAANERKVSSTALHWMMTKAKHIWKVSDWDEWWKMAIGGVGIVGRSCKLTTDLPVFDNESNPGSTPREEKVSRSRLCGYQHLLWTSVGMVTITVIIRFRCFAFTTQTPCLL